MQCRNLSRVISQLVLGMRPQQLNRSDGALFVNLIVNYYRTRTATVLRLDGLVGENQSVTSGDLPSRVRHHGPPDPPHRHRSQKEVGSHGIPRPRNPSLSVPFHHPTSHSIPAWTFLWKTKQNYRMRVCLSKEIIPMTVITVFQRRVPPTGATVDSHRPTSIRRALWGPWVTRASWCEKPDATPCGGRCGRP